MELYFDEELSLREISKTMGVHRTVVTSLVKKLESEVVRRKEPCDGDVKIDYRKIILAQQSCPSVKKKLFIDEIRKQIQTGKFKKKRELFNYIREMKDENRNRLHRYSYETMVQVINGELAETE